MNRSTLSKAAAGIFAILLSACRHESPTQASPEEGPPAESAPLQSPTPIPAAVYKGDSVIDPVTGAGYLLNPNRKLVSGRSGLQKGQGLQAENADWSGTIWTRIYECSARGTHVSVVCAMDPEYVVVGGGAYADYGTGPGALLTESRPTDPLLQSWTASSKDHLEPNFNTLYCYVIGMRIDGMSRSTLHANMKLATAVSSVTAHPGIGAGFPMQDYVVVGGGARVDWRATGSEGNLLTQSYPYFADIGWYAASKDHKKSNPSSITTYAIGITSSWFGSNGALEKKIARVAGPIVTKGVSTASVDVTPGWVLTGPGGVTIYDHFNAGRLLYGIRPEGWGTRVGVYAKDHLVACPGNSEAYAVQIQRKR